MWKQWLTKIEDDIFTMGYTHPLGFNRGLWATSELVHVHRSRRLPDRSNSTLNICDLVTGCEVPLVSDKIHQLDSWSVFVTVVRPWGVHELQSVHNKVSNLFP